MSKNNVLSVRPNDHEKSNVVYGRLLESTHISGYSFERACSELEWLLDEDRWREVGPGHNDINQFLETVDLSAFNMSAPQRRLLVKKLDELKATQRQVARSIGVGLGTVQRDLATDPNGSLALEQPNKDQDILKTVDPDGSPEWFERDDDEIVKRAKKAKRRPPKKEHPAPFNDSILDQVVDHLKEVGGMGFPEDINQEWTVLDPFAGIGRVHELRDQLNVVTVGVEIEPEWADKHPDTIQGNALELTKLIEPESIDAIVTSPTYGNRMADHHDAGDDSVRLTYKHTLGHDLHPDNSGQLQWGDEYCRFHEVAWAKAVATLRPGGTFTLNIKNHISDGKEQRVAEWHQNTLYDLGMRLVASNVLPTKGVMAGENADVRTLGEYVMTFRKDGIR